MTLRPFGVAGILSALVVAQLVFAEPRGGEYVAPAELAARRAKTLELMKERHGDAAVMLLQSREPAHFAGDVNYRYRPDNNLYYLTGIDEPGFALLLSVTKMGEHGHELLFLTPQNPAMRAWVGERLNAERAAARSGLQRAAVLKYEEFDRSMSRVLGVGDRRRHHHHHLYHHRFHLSSNAPPRPFLFQTDRGFGPGQAVSPSYAFLIEKLGSQAFHLQLHPPGSIIHRQRQIKSPRELEILKRAIDATCSAHLRLMREVRPGMYEYEMRAIIESTFVKAGCAGWGFPSIVGSGPNSCVLHYERYDRQAQAGELVLIDIGAEYGYFSADLSRTLPLSGRFSPRQKKLYNLVLRAQNEVLRQIKPGVTLRRMNSVAHEVIGAGLVELGVIKTPAAVRKYLPHGVTHGIGLAVHDPMPQRKLESGMVVTVEPGVYLPDEAIGIRIEDDVVITNDGCRVLSAKLPRTVEEIEAIMTTRAF